MACLDYEWEHAPLLQIWKEIQDSNGNSTAILESFTPVEAVSIFTQALSFNEVNFYLYISLFTRGLFFFFFLKIQLLFIITLQLSIGGIDIPLPFNKEILQWANKTREILSSTKLPPNVKFYNVYGTGRDTPQSVWYKSTLFLHIFCH